MYQHRQHRQPRSLRVSRRSLLRAGLGAAGIGALAACTSAGSSTSTATGTIGTPSRLVPTSGQKVVTARLTPGPATIDLGGRTLTTWTYGDALPGRTIRATAGDLLRVTVENRLPVDTSVHWHGIRLRNVADGVPGVTQAAIAPGERYLYEFTAPDPGTYFFHPHSGLQLDRGLYAPLVVDDPREPGDYDAEWVVVLDDWVDGTGTSPDDVLADLLAGGSSVGGMPGMAHGSMGMGPGPFGHAGDVVYPHHVINGRLPSAPAVLTAKPRQRVRIRIISAASDTIYAVALQGHELTVTQSDGYPVAATTTPALYIGMGERYDVVVTLQDGVFPFTATPFGKSGQARALVRTGTGRAAPDSRQVPAAPVDRTLLGADLAPAPSARLTQRDPDATAQLTLNGQMQPYRWGMNGAPFGQNTPLTVRQGQRLRLEVTNQTMMTHPLHVHGHTFALADTGLRKDTVLLRPMETRALDLDADNTGDWMIHCHNIYHAEAGMMIRLDYAKPTR